MKHIARVHILAVIASTLVLPATSSRAGAEARAAARGIQLAGPTIPAPKIPKNPSSAPGARVAA